MCEHKPRELLRAMYGWDPVLTCQKCGRTIVSAEGESGFWLGSGVICLIAIWIASSLIDACFPKQNAYWIMLIFALAVLAVRRWLWAMVWTEWEPGEGEPPAARTNRARPRVRLGEEGLPGERGVFMLARDDRDGQLLQKLLAGIELSKYVWVVDELDVPWEEPGGLEERCYTAGEFCAALRAGSAPLFGRIFAYPAEGGWDGSSDMADYAEYLKSDCRMAVLIADGAYVELYAKDAGERDAIYAACMEIDHRELERITDANDGRTGFHIG